MCDSTVGYLRRDGCVVSSFRICTGQFLGQTTMQLVYGLSRWGGGGGLNMSIGWFVTGCKDGCMDGL